MAHLAPMPWAPPAATVAAGTTPFPPLAPFGDGGGRGDGALAPFGDGYPAVASMPGLAAVHPAASLGTFGGAGPSVLPTFMMGNSYTVPFVDAEVARTMEPAQSRDDPEEFNALLQSCQIPRTTIEAWKEEPRRYTTFSAFAFAFPDNASFDEHLRWLLADEGGPLLVVNGTPHWELGLIESNWKSSRWAASCRRLLFDAKQKCTTVVPPQQSSPASLFQPNVGIPDVPHMDSVTRARILHIFNVRYPSEDISHQNFPGPRLQDEVYIVICMPRNRGVFLTHA